MAIEALVSIALVNTEPPVAGNPGVLVRSQISATFPGDDSLSDVAEVTVIRSRVRELVEQARVDVDTQLSIGERNGLDGGPHD